MSVAVETRMFENGVELGSLKDELKRLTLLRNEIAERQDMAFMWEPPHVSKAYHRQVELTEDRIIVLQDEIAALKKVIDRDINNVANFNRLKADRLKADRLKTTKKETTKKKTTKKKTTKKKTTKKKTTKTKPVTFNRQDCQSFAERILATKSWLKRLAICDEILATLPAGGPRTWHGNVMKFRNWVAAIVKDPLSISYAPFAIFILKGNVKLPFVSFSTLPGFTCPGAGDCLKFCYSYTAWRYPGGFLRQLQNTLLLETFEGRKVITRAFLAVKVSKKTGKIIVRLYVDGDFDSTSTFVYWMRLLEQRSHDCEAYGYSKSWLEIIQGLAYLEFVPTNYVLNVSSGSLHNDTLRDDVLALPITRQVFDAVAIDSDGIDKGFKRYKNPEYHNRARETYFEATGNRAFSCPGDCGNCLPNSGKHACGNLQFDVPIINGVH